MDAETRHCPHCGKGMPAKQRVCPNCLRNSVPPGMAPAKPLIEKAVGEPSVIFTVVAALVIFAGWFLWSQCAAEEVPFSGEVESWEAVDEANVELRLQMTNEGDEPAKGQCTVRAYDASRSVGFDIFTSPDDLAPGASETFRGAIRIEDEGAFRVQRVEAEGCEEG